MKSTCSEDVPVRGGVSNQAPDKIRQINCNANQNMNQENESCMRKKRRRPRKRKSQENGKGNIRMINSSVLNKALYPDQIRILKLNEKKNSPTPLVETGEA